MFCALLGQRLKACSTPASASSPFPGNTEMVAYEVAKPSEQKLAALPGTEFKSNFVATDVLSLLCARPSFNNPAQKTQEQQY